jgi:hypothetical protein
MRLVHPEFRTEVAVGSCTVVGVLPGTAWRPEGSIAISGDVHGLWRDRACELADALLVVVARMDDCAAERYGTNGGASSTG